MSDSRHGVLDSSWHVASQEYLEPLAVLIIGIAAFVAFSMYIGPDLNWDFLNYHLYIGMHASGDSMASSFYPAGGMSYVTPYAYWPLGLMVAAKWPAMLVGGSLAAIGALAVIVTWYLAKQLFPGRTATATRLRAVATILGIASPLVLTEVGTSFIDLTTAVPCVLGLALLLRALNSGSTASKILGLSGLCFGISAALKFTNVPFALAGFLTVTAIWLCRPDISWRGLSYFLLGQMLGFAIVYGPWGIQLWREFGNPFFPFLDSYFQSARFNRADMALSTEFSLERLWESLLSVRGRLHQRFLPHSVGDWLLRPLYMLDPVANVYTEVRAPDARLLALFLIAPVALWKLRSRLISSKLVVAMIFFVFGWTFWMALFGNGRYLLPILLITGPLVVGCANEVWHRPSLGGLVAICVFVVLHVALLWEGTRYRWNESAWQDKWISAELPKGITDDPATFVVFDVQSGSWLNAFVHPKSRFVNPIGQGSQPSSQVGDRYSRLLTESSAIVAVFRFDFVDRKSGMPVPPTPSNRNVTAIQQGLQVDFDACQTGHLVEANADRTVTLVRDGERVEHKGIYGLFFCPASYSPKLADQFRPNPLYEAVFSKIELACPRQFPPNTGKTICASTTCWRTYFSTDTNVIVEADGEVSTQYFGAYQLPYVGKVEAILAPEFRMECHEELGRYKPWDPGANLFIK